MIRRPPQRRHPAIPKSKYFTPSPVSTVTPAAKLITRTTATVKAEAPPPARLTFPKHETSQPLAGLAQILRPPEESERPPQHSHKEISNA